MKFRKKFLTNLFLKNFACGLIMEGRILTPMMKQYIATKKEYPDGILLFRAGDFYEMFYDVYYTI